MLNTDLSSDVGVVGPFDNALSRDGVSPYLCNYLNYLVLLNTFYFGECLMTYWVSENHASWPIMGTNILCTCDSESEIVLTDEYFEIVMLNVCICCN
jgi:hypothetical protein